MVLRGAVGAAQQHRQALQASRLGRSGLSVPHVPHGGRHCQQQQQQQQQGTAVACRATQQQEEAQQQQRDGPSSNGPYKSPAEMTIEDLDTNYCDDFVCTSSPAVGATVRSLARDITRLSYNTNFFQPDVTYSDGVRSFKGSDKYRAAFWPRSALKQPAAVVTRMAMLDNSRAQIEWELRGQLAAFSVVIPVTSVFELNQLTGRVISHTESWDLSKLPPPAAAAATASRLLWSAQAAGRDASDAVGKAAESLSSLASQDDEDEYYANPADPTRFFQKDDNGMNDVIMLATGVAGLYLVYKTFEALETLQ